MELQAAEGHYQEGLAAFRRGDNDECRRLSQLALGEASADGDRRVQALAHVGLSRAAFRDGEYAGGLEHAERARVCASAAGAPREHMMGLHMRAEILRAQARYEDALAVYRELLELDQKSGDAPALAMEHYNLASVLLQLDALDEAELHLERSHELSAADDDQFPYTMLGWAGLFARRGDVGLAGQVMGAVNGVFDAAGEVLDPAEALEFASHVAAAEARDAAAFAVGREATSDLPDPMKFLRTVDVHV
jgi:tetratricopeptide (TPR) repeat protein